MVLNYKIVPNDTRIYVAKLLEEIWTIPNLEKKCEVVYTDNPKVDRGSIQQIYTSCFPKDIQIAVLLDVFHARARVLKEMSKSHPDYRVAKSDLTSIFSKLQVYGSYSSAKYLSQDFDNWLLKYSIIYPSSALTFSEQIKFISKNQKR
jgi:hypothetical protein